MTRVYWDSMLFIYMLEANPIFGPKVRKILQQSVSREDTVCTSVFSIGEILTGPRRRGSVSGVDAVRKYFLSGAIEILPFTEKTADLYSIARSANHIRQATRFTLHPRQRPAWMFFSQTTTTSASCRFPESNSSPTSTAS